MSTDYCSYLRSHLGEKLSKLGLVEAGCHQFGQDFEGHGKLFAGSVIYFRGPNRLVAIPYSAGDGVSCFVGDEQQDPSTYKSWTSLWVLTGMVENVDYDDDLSVLEGLEQFPEGPDEMLALVAEKLEQAFAS